MFTHGIPSQLSFDGTNRLLSAIELTGKGDIYIAGDADYIEMAARKNLVDTSMTVCYFEPVIMVQKGNPHDIRTLEDLIRKKVKTGQGDERQRIALARALAVSPSVMLFDEPVSAVDESARNSICKELAALQQQLSIPFVHVCHSVEETSLVATRVAIMRDGRIFRQGALEDLLEHPKDVYTAGLLKTYNVLSVKGDGNDGSFICNGTVLQGPIARNVASVMVHPWNIRFASAEHSENRVEATVTHIRRRGPQVELGLFAGVPLRMFSAPEEVSLNSISPGSAVTVSLPPEFLQALEG